MTTVTLCEGRRCAAAKGCQGLQLHTAGTWGPLLPQGTQPESNSEHSRKPKRGVRLASKM